MSGELVLSRKYGEAIVIDTDDGPICVTVRSIRGDRVRLGVAAPPVCRVMRGELDRGGGRRFDEEFRR